MSVLKILLLKKINLIILSNYNSIHFLSTFQSLFRSVVKAVFPVRSEVQWPSSLIRTHVNSRDQASLSKRGDSRYSRLVRQSGMPDLRQCIQKLNSRDKASLCKYGDSRFPRSVRSATTYVTASRRWTLGIRRLSWSVVTAVFPVQSGVQRPSSMHPEVELSGSGVSLWKYGDSRFSRSVRSATTYVTASRRWTLGIRRLYRSMETAVFPVQSGLQRPSSLHPEGELSGAGVSLEACWQPFSPFSPECNDLRHCIRKVNSSDQPSLSKRRYSPFSPVQSGVQQPSSLHPEGELLGSAFSLEAWWQTFFPVQSGVQRPSSLHPEGEHCGSGVTIEVWRQPFFRFSVDCSDLRHCIQKMNSRNQASLSKRGDSRFSRSVRSATTFVTASKRWILGIRRLSRRVVTAVFPVQSGVQRPSSLHPEGVL